MTDSRQHLLDALVTLTAERGLERVSIREVADGAGVSIGTVQYYCRSKDEMLLMTFEHIAASIGQRLSSIGDTGTASDALRRALLELLPLDDLRSVESRVYLAFAAKAAVSPAIAAVQHNLLSQTRTCLSLAFRRAIDLGEMPADLDPDAASAATLALIDGLLLHILTDPIGLPTHAAVAALDAHLDRYTASASNRTQNPTGESP